VLGGSSTTTSDRDLRDLATSVVILGPKSHGKRYCLKDRIGVDLCARLAEMVSLDDLVRALGADSGISKSEVSRICADLDAEVSAFRDRSLAGQRFPYVLWTPPTARPGSTGGSSPRRWWLPALAPMAAGKCSALRSATARTAPSGRSFSGR
jgi:hypothetical protein